MGQALDMQTLHLVLALGGAVLPAGGTVLAPCPSSPNCVSTDATDPGHAIAPIPLDVAPDVAAGRLRQALATLPRVRIVSDDGRHIRAEATSCLFRFVDDVDLVVDEAAGVIHMRSASRTGYSDLGANRKRLEAIRRAYGAGA